MKSHLIFTCQTYTSIHFTDEEMKVQEGWDISRVILAFTLRSAGLWTHARFLTAGFLIPGIQ